MTLWDRILILLLVISSLTITLVVHAVGKDGDYKEVIVQVDGEVVKRISIEDSSREGLYPFRYGGNTGYIEVKRGAVRMLEMDRKICPKGICSDIGWIDKAYQSIVCLPNRIIVSFSGGEKEGLDVISY